MARYYVEEIPGINGAALMIAPSILCPVARQLGSFFATRETAERRAADLNAALASASGQDGR
jgi:hypothetical protein